MKKLIHFIISIAILGGVIWWFSGRSISDNHSSAKKDLSFIKPPASGPDLQRWFFEKWHEPYGAVLAPDFLKKTWREIHTLPTEEQLENMPSSHWYLIGPRGMKRSSGVTYSGRILDIFPPKDGASLRIAAASGGMWQYKQISPFFSIPLPMTNRLNTQAVSTITARPGDKNAIIIGTGEAFIRGGTGMFRKPDSLTPWIPIALSPQPNVIYRVRYTPNNPNVVHAVTNTGYFRSDDGGVNWTQHMTGDVTDIAIDPLATHLIYITRWGAGGGVYKSTDGGNSWLQLINGLPSNNVGRSAIGLCKGNAKVLYASLGRDDNNALLGIYKSTDNGQNWANVSPPDLSVIGGNAWYNNVVGVCPTNANIVLIGMTQLLRTTDGGANWNRINTLSVHVDHHAITWANDGMTVWNGNDGGITKSEDRGATWETERNTLPITQFYHIDVSKSDPQITFGGAQDNGLVGITTNGGDWWQRKGGDGAGIAIDPEDASRIYAANGLSPGAVAFRRYRSTNTGLQWITFVIGITGDLTWAPKVRTNGLDADRLYTNAENYVYVSETPHDIWQKMNSNPFPSPVSEITVSKDNTVYACLDSIVPFVPQRLRLYVYTNGSWIERSNGLPDGVRVRKVVPHPVWPNRAYALMNGLNSPGEQMYRTDNNGITWTNVTGNLPNLPLADLVIYPTISQDRRLYLGTEFGCYRTTDGGTNWHRWNYGMPEANIITEMASVDSLLINGKFYIVAGTYGRSIWMREAHGDDPAGIAEDKPEVSESFALLQNYPNPFNPSTNIGYQIGAAGQVELSIYDLLGREVKTLVDAKQTAGRYTVQWDGANHIGEPVAGGVYFYRLQVSASSDQTGNFRQTRKLMLLR